MRQTNHFFPYFPLPPPPQVAPPYQPLTPPPFPVSPTPPHRISPPSPPPHLVPPPPPHHISPPPPHHIPPPSPPHLVPPPPPGNHHHPTVIVVVFVSLGGLFFLAFIAAAMFCFVKRKRKTVQKAEIISLEDHTEVKEEIMTGPHGEQMKVITMEEDLHFDEVVRKSEDLRSGSHVTFKELPSTSGSTDHGPEHNA
ncbi:hypothetical protein ACFE04_012665 [Oxalis oulophora]